MAESRPLDHVFDSVSRSTAAGRPPSRRLSTTQALYRKAEVGGVNRYKYFKRPLKQILHGGVPPDVLLAPTKRIAQQREAGATGDILGPHAGISSAGAAAATVIPQVTTTDDGFQANSNAGSSANLVEGSRTFGTQTMYRESEAQTDPYTPDYFVSDEGGEPEVLSLTHLSYADGTLPAGLAEVEAIERARARRTLEAQLPHVEEGPHALEQRKKVLEQQELEDWERREGDLAKMQNARLKIMLEELRARERDVQADHHERMERFARMRAEELDNQTATIHARRIKAQRRVVRGRKELDQSLAKKKSIIQEYADYGSKIYAPATREGYKPPPRQRVPNPMRATLAGLEEVERRFPEHSTVAAAHMVAPRVVAKKFRSRKGQKLSAILDYTLNKFDQQRKAAEEQRKKLEKDTIHAQSGSSLMFSGAAGMSDRSQSSARFRAQQEQLEAQRAVVVDDTIVPILRDLVERAHRIAEFDDIPVRHASSDEPLTIEERSIAHADAEIARELSTTLDRLELEKQRADDLKEIEKFVDVAERTRTRREAEESGRRQKEGFEAASGETVGSEIASDEAALKVTEATNKEVGDQAVTDKLPQAEDESKSNGAEE